MAESETRDIGKPHVQQEDGQFSLLTGVLLTAAYFGLGWLWLPLALPPIGAAVYFPPGIAIGACYIWGPRVLPWVWLGAVLLHLQVSPQFGLMALATSSVIGLASIAQAYVGGTLLRRWIGLDSLFDSGQHITRYLLMAPLICTISSTLSIIAFSLMGLLDASTSGLNWLTWWIGDTMGMVVMFPLFMAVFGRPRAQWRSRRIGVIGPTLLAALLIVSGYLRVASSERSQFQQAFQLQSQEFALQLQARLGELEFMLDQIDALMRHSGDTPLAADQFAAFVDQAMQRYPNVQAVEWAPSVSLADRADFEARFQNTLPSLGITERNAEGQLVRAGVRDHYYPVTLLSPLAGNEEVLGFDLGSEETRRASLLRAMDSNEAVATAPIELVQEQERQAGMLLLRRVSTGAHAPGVLLSVLRMGDFVGALVNRPQDMTVRLVDSASQQRLFGPRPVASTAPFFQADVVFGGREFQLSVDPTSALIRAQSRWRSFWFLGAGMAANALLAALMLLITGYTVRVEEAVRERTAALKAQSQRNQALAVEAKTALRARNRFLSKISHELLTPMNGIQGLLGMMRQTELGEKQAIYVDMAQVSSGQLMRLVNSVLDYTVLETGAWKVDRNEFGMSAVVSRVCDPLEARLRDKNMQLATRISPDVPSRLVGDDTAVAQVLDCLMDNAVKFGKENGRVELDVQLTRTDAAEVGVQFSVKDDGIGIDAAELEDMFKPFAQQDDSFSRAEDGLGIGLALAHRLVKVMGGRIWAESELGQGSTFHFALNFGVVKNARGGANDTA